MATMTQISYESVKQNEQQQQQRRPRSRRLWDGLAWMVVLVVAASIFAVALWNNHHSMSIQEPSAQEQVQQAPNVAVLTTDSKNTSQNVFVLQEGIVEGAAYYHCKNIPSEQQDGQQRQRYDIVLLHGSAFTKENWKKSGILELFCSWHSHDDSVLLSVTALDISVRSTHDVLQTVLSGLQKTKQQEMLLGIQLPIAGLVTPSASGGMVVDWVEEDSDPVGAEKHVAEMRQSWFRTWLPVASYGVLHMKESDLSLLKKAGLPILSIYGDKDPSGKTSSERLSTFAGAQMKELPGRHPCYLDSPRSFVDTVISFVTTQS